MKIFYNDGYFTVLLREYFLRLTLEEADELVTKLGFEIQDYYERGKDETKV